MYKKERRGRSYKKNPIAETLATGAAYTLGAKLVDQMLNSLPKGKRSKFAKEIKKRNPSAELDEVAKMSEEWHGRPSQEVTEIDEIESYESDVADLADLEELGVLNENLKQFTISFKVDRPKLVCDKRGKNLEFLGGDQELSLEDYRDKSKVPIGYCYCIVYETDKHHLEGSNGYPESYEHFFGEEYYKECGYSQDDFESSDDYFDQLKDDGIVKKAIKEGYLPMIVYNVVDKKLSLVGGRYDVGELGIRD